MDMSDATRPLAAVPSASPRCLVRSFLRFTVALLVAWASWEAWYVLFGGNVHAVIPGGVYRGAQLSPRKLDALVQRLGIRTIINLRGCCAPEEWYLDEARVAQKHGINLEDLTFSASRLPSKNELRLLIDVLERSERPVYFHCRQGSDRTGLAAATALLLSDDSSYAAARTQLGMRYAHLPFGQTGRLDAVFDLYEAWLTKTGQTHSPQAYRTWVTNEYQGGWCQSRFEKIERLGSARAGQPLGFRCQIRNLGPERWRIRPSSIAGVHLGGKLLDDLGRDVFEGRGGLFEATIAPGEVYEATIVVPLPQRGRYRLLLDMVEEGHCWFYQAGAEPWEEELVIDG
jgi:protein tyrosine phosphatase (PTP) superfamily phosphohydrolase (DUF442 family)